MIFDVVKKKPFRCEGSVRQCQTLTHWNQPCSFSSPPCTSAAVMSANNPTARLFFLQYFYFTLYSHTIMINDYHPWRLFSYKEISQLRRTYNSARVFVTQVASLFLHSHSPMGRQSDTTGERSGAGPTFTCSPMHGCINHQLPGSGLLCESLLKPTKRFRPDSGIEPETSCSAAALATARPTRQSNNE